MKSTVCALPVLHLIWTVLEELSLFSPIQLSQILPLQAQVRVYFLFINDYNHLTPDDHSIRKIRLNSSPGQTEA